VRRETSLEASVIVGVFRQPAGNLTAFVRQDGDLVDQGADRTIEVGFRPLRPPGELTRREAKAFAGKIVDASAPGVAASTPKK